jgi:hypothetical protein
LIALAPPFHPVSARTGHRNDPIRIQRWCLGGLSLDAAVRAVAWLGVRRISHAIVMCAWASLATQPRGVQQNNRREGDHQPSDRDLKAHVHNLPAIASSRCPGGRGFQSLDCVADGRVERPPPRTGRSPPHPEPKGGPGGGSLGMNRGRLPTTRDSLVGARTLTFRN